MAEGAAAGERAGALAGAARAGRAGRRLSSAPPRRAACDRPPASRLPTLERALERRRRAVADGRRDGLDAGALGFVSGLGVPKSIDSGTASSPAAALAIDLVLLALQLEERDLVEAHGETYVEYRGRVPILVPLWRPRRRPADSAGPETHKGF